EEAFLLMKALAVIGLAALCALQLEAQESAKKAPAAPVIAARFSVSVYAGPFDDDLRGATVSYRTVNEFYTFAALSRATPDVGARWFGDLGIGYLSRTLGLIWHVRAGLRTIRDTGGPEKGTRWRGVSELGFEFPRGPIRVFWNTRKTLVDRKSTTNLFGLRFLVK
ncbi:MAG: hypothetical protein ACE5HT_08175, partial [Gemmatimonadales bacterium]